MEEENEEKKYKEEIYDPTVILAKGTPIDISGSSESREKARTVFKLMLFTQQSPELTSHSW